MVNKRRVELGDLVKVPKFFSDKSEVTYYPGRVIYIFKDTKFGTHAVDCEVEFQIDGVKFTRTFKVDELDFDVEAHREKILKELGL